MKRLLFILFFLPALTQAQTFLVSPDGNIPHDSLTMYVTPTQLADSMAAGGPASYLYPTAPLSSTVTVIKDQAATNSALSLGTLGATVTTDALGVTQTTTSGLSLTNNTAAALGAQQISPALNWKGLGWGTTAGTSQAVDFRAYVLPVQGATPTGAWTLQARIGVGAYADKLVVTSGGNVGIGIASPAARLSIGNDGAYDGTVFFGAVGANTTRIARFASSFEIVNNGTPSLLGQGFSVAGSNRTMEFIGSAANTTDNSIFTIRTSSASSAFGTPTSGAKAFLNMGTNLNFAPTSGTATYSILNLISTINQTGGANGITRGIYLNPTITAAADYRALEITNTTGQSIVTSTAPSTFNGVVTLANNSVLGTPASATLTNATGLPLTTGLTGGNWKTIYTDGSGVVNELALGSAGKVLTTNGAAAAPTWETPTPAVDPNALTIATMTSTLDVTQRNGVNSALYLSTVGAKILSNNLGIAHANNEGLDLINTTAATAGGAANQQISPALWLEGQGWKTNATAASQSVRFKIYNSPNQGAAAPTGNLTFTSNINAGGEIVNMYLNSSGLLTTTNGYLSTAGNLDIQGNDVSTSGTVNRIHMDGSFVPASGTAVYNGLNISGTINQSLGGTGITRGIYVSSGLNTPADYRGIELTNSLGKSIVTSSAPSSFGGTIQGTYLTASEMLITDGSKNIVSAPVATYPSLTELTYLKGVTSGIQSQINGKQSTITFGTGVQTALGVNIGSAGAPVLFNGAGGTPSSMTGTNITGTAAGLTAGNVTTNANLTGPITSVGNATSIASQTGTGTKFVVDNTPTLITPNIGVATGTSLNTGTTLNGTIFAKSANVLSLASTNHALTAGNEASGVNLAIGLYSTSTAIQARSNGSATAMFLNPLGGSLGFGDGSVTGSRIFAITNTGSGTGDFSGMEVRNASASSADALRFYQTGTGFTASGMNLQDAASISTGTNISGGLSIGTQASADMRLYTNNTLRWTMAGATGNITAAGSFVSSGGGIGYTTGAGGTVSQATSRTTTVVNNKLTGTITMFSAAQAADALVTFTLTNSFIEATDYLAVQHTSATNGGAWNISTVCGAGSATINIRNVSNASITEATPLRFIILKSVNN